MKYVQKSEPDTHNADKYLQIRELTSTNIHISFALDMS